MDVRTISTTVTQTLTEAGRPLDAPTTMAVATAVVRNPLAGRGVVDDLSELVVLGSGVAAMLVDQCLAALSAPGLEPSHVPR